MLLTECAQTGYPLVLLWNAGPKEFQLEIEDKNIMSYFYKYVVKIKAASYYTEVRQTKNLSDGL